MSEASRRLSSDDLPSRVELRWGDRLLEVRHLAVGQRWAVEDLRFEATRAGTRLLDSDEVVLAAGPGERVSRTVGSLHVTIEPPMAVQRVTGRAEVDVRFFKIVTMALLTFAAAVTAFVITPTGFGGEDLFGGPPVKLSVKLAPEQTVTRKRPEFDKKPEPTVTAKRSLLESSAPVDKAQKATKDQKKVSQLMASMFGGGLGRVLGNGANAGLDEALNNLKAPGGAASADGLGGMNARGIGAGGPPGGGLSIGGLGGPRPSGPGGFGLNPTKKQTFVPGDGPRQVIGNGLEKDVVMAVIRRHQNEIKYCYESRLSQRPSLAGKISVTWTIDGSGAIADAQVAESGVDDPMVEACMLERIRRWKFPEPRGGGVVVITFPWVFRAAGSED